MRSAATVTRKESTTRRRSEILEAALRCFDRRGVVASTMEDIRLAAGVSVGSLYHHFPNKEAVVAALYVNLIADYQNGAEAAVSRGRTPRARVRAAVEHHILWSISHEAATRFLLAHREPEVRRLTDPTVVEMNRALEARLDEWLDTQTVAGTIPPLSPDIYIALVIGPAQSYVRRWLSGSATTSPDQAIEVLSQAALRALRVEASQKRPCATRPPS